MIPTKLYVVASRGDGDALPPPPPEVERLCRNMRQRGPNWAYRSDIAELDAQHLFTLCLKKYSLAGGLSVGYTMRWETAQMVAHAVNPDRPNQWVYPVTRESLRVEVHHTGGPSYVFLVLDQPELGPISGGWEEVPVLE